MEVIKTLVLARKKVKTFLVLQPTNNSTLPERKPAFATSMSCPTAFYNWDIPRKA